MCMKFVVYVHLYDTWKIFIYDVKERERERERERAQNTQDV